ncbi:MAG: hypothetical protein VYC39_05785 [Myxococcota bacterium]|nr:hypothetical protein [Myxococcota bacterium]
MMPANRRPSTLFRSIALAFGLTCFFPAIGFASLGTDYEHPLVQELSIRSLDVIVSIQGPPKRVSGDLTLELPPVVTLSSPVFLSGFVQADSQSALREAIKVFCDGRKIECNFVIGAAGTSTSSSAIVETSTKTLAQHISQSSADAVLIIQANVVDEFTIDRGVGNTILETPQGREWVQDFRPESSQGRLFLAQGFLFDCETGIRLWSRRAPEFPSTNRLRARDPFLKYGMTSNTDNQELLAVESAKAFSDAFLSTLPMTEPFDDQESRAKLRTIDRHLIEARLQLADRKPVGLYFDVGWTRLSFALPATLFDDTALPNIDPNSLTPNGVLTARANLTLFSEDRWLWNFAVPVYSDFSAGFARSYYQDEPLENQGLNARPRLVNIQYESLFGWGLEASSGLRYLLSQSWMFSTLFGAFYDNVSIVVSPSEIKVPSNISRFGVVGSGEITYFGPSGPENGYFTAAMRLKTGFDSQGYWILDPIFTLGAGILL